MKQLAIYWTKVVSDLCKNKEKYDTFEPDIKKRKKIMNHQRDIKI